MVDRRPRVASALPASSASRYVGSIAATLVLAGVVDDDGRGLSTMLLWCIAIMVPAIACARWLPGRRPAMLEPVGERRRTTAPWGNSPGAGGMAPGQCSGVSAPAWAVAGSC